MRTAKSLTWVSVNGAGEYWNFRRFARTPSLSQTKDGRLVWDFDHCQLENDFRAAMEPQRKEKPRLRQMELALEWPPEPVIIQLQFVFDFELAA